MDARQSIPETRVIFTRLAREELLERYRKAFHVTTGCALRLVRADEHAHSEFETMPFVTELCVPVELDGCVLAYLCAEPVRISDGAFATFQDAARQMLEDGNSAQHVREAQRLFEKLPGMSAEHARAVETMLQLFAQQLGDHAGRLFLQIMDNEPESVRRGRQFILTHLAEPLSLEEVARNAGVSPFHFCKVFKRATGLTFTGFVNRARVEWAKRLLLKPRMRVTEVAYDVGFQSLSQFNRGFRRVMSKSPTEYRSGLGSGRSKSMASS